MLSLCLVFQFPRMVFLAVVMARSIVVLLLGAGLITVRSPSKRSEGDKGRLTFFQWPPPRRFELGGGATWHDSNCLHGLVYMMSKCLCLWFPFYVRFGEFYAWLYTVLAVYLYFLTLWRCSGRFVTSNQHWDWPVGHFSIFIWEIIWFCLGLVIVYIVWAAVSLYF